LTSAQRLHLEESLKTTLRREYRRRIEIMLLADDGRSQSQICDQLGCSHETARYWITIAQSGNALDWRDRPMGRPRTVSEHYRNRLKELVNSNPREFGYAFRRWTARWLAKHLEKELNIKVSHRYVNYLLKEMGLSTRPHRPEPSANFHCPPSPSVVPNLADEGNRRLPLLKTG
jgi:putative transposase